MARSTSIESKRDLSRFASMLSKSLSLRPQGSGNRLGFDRSNDPRFGDYSRDELCGRNVKGGVVDPNALGSGLAPEAVGDLSWVALFDGYGRPIGNRQVERTLGCGHVKRNAVRRASRASP